MTPVKSFLEKNGFKLIGEDTYSNYLCMVSIEDTNYSVVNVEGDEMCSDNLSIYWLIGVLTFQGYINKNYKI